MRHLAYFLLLGTALSPAEIIDQLAVAVDNSIITSSQIVDEIRVTAFLNGEPPDFSAANRRRTADRMVEQLLVGREMELTHYAQPNAADIEQSLRQLKARFPDEAAYRRELAAYKLTEKDVENALLRQAALVRFVDLRFRPEVQVQESDVVQYYENVLLPELRKKGAPEPALEDARQQCEEGVAAQLVDRRVDEWLKESRSRSRIRYEEEAFQ